MSAGIFIVGVALVLAATPAGATDAPVDTHVDPEVLAQEAVDHNPGLRASGERARMLSERAAAAGVWMDPMVAIEYSNAPLPSLSLADSPMAGLQFKLQQTVPPPGWSGLRRAVAEDQADVGSRATEEGALLLRAGVHRAYWQLARTRLLHAITVAHAARVAELAGSARARFETGAAGQNVLLRMQVLHDRLLDDLGDYDRAERELVAAIDQALSRAPGATYPTPLTLAARPPPAPADWVAVAEVHRPELARIEAERTAAADAAALARRDLWPDLTVWVGYRARFDAVDMGGDADLVALGVSVPIPAGSLRKARGEEAAQDAAARAAGDAAMGTRDAIQAQMTQILARWTRAAAKAETYERSLAPTAEIALQSALADYSVGRADFATLFDAELTLLDLDRGLVMAQTDTWLQRVDALATLGSFPEP